MTPQSGGVRETLDRYAHAYETLRRDMPTGRDRTLRLTTLTAEARAVARSAPMATADLRHMLDSGGDGERVIALALAQDHPDARLLGPIVAAIANSRSAFEQYQALGAAFEVLPQLDDAGRKRLQETLESIREDPVRDVQSDTSRARLVDAILDSLAPR